MTKISFNPLEGCTKKQASILKTIYETGVRYNAVNGTRQSGKTVTGENALSIFGLKKRKQLGCVCAPTNKQVKNFFTRFLERFPKFLIKKTNNTDANREIKFINDTRVVFLSTNRPDTFRGFSFDFIISDEHAFTTEKAWTEAIAPTIQARKQAKVLFISTPKGKNHFYKMCKNGQNKEAINYAYYFLHYTDNPYYYVDEIEEKRKELPKAIFLQEYEGQFITGTSTVFGDYSHVQNVRSWQKKKEGEKFYFGIDWSGDGDDNTTLTIINQYGKVCRLETIYGLNSLNKKKKKGELLPEGRLQDKVNEIAEIIKEYDAKGYTENNGLGLGASEMLENELGYDKVTQFTMTNTSKQDLVTTFIRDLNEANIQLPTSTLCSILDAEMTSYEVSRTATGKLKYEHSKDTHDDHIDSVMMANKARHELQGTSISTYSLDEGDYFDEYDMEDIYS